MIKDLNKKKNEEINELNLTHYIVQDDSKCNNKDIYLFMYMCKDQRS